MDSRSPFYSFGRSSLEDTTESGGSIAGGGAAYGGSTRELDQTPTWAVASICAVIVLISILLEKGLHHTGLWFTERRKKALYEALEKVKSELMILGFISLLLTFGQSYITKICISDGAADTMLPCKLEKTVSPDGIDHYHRNLLSLGSAEYGLKRRVLAEGKEIGSSCPSGTVSLISIHALHQLHIFIFFLAIFHVVYSAVTMALGRAKIRAWKEWEKETTSVDYDYSNDPARFRFSHETSFVRQHTGLWNRISISLYFVSFFRQFFRSVRKPDYLSLRHGFVTAHLTPGSKFDFQKYIKRSLEDDFKVVVGISPVLWASAIILLLLNVNGWDTLLWISILPLMIILAAGTKLQAIISKMAIEIKERHAVIQGIPLVQLSDHHFWFGRPHFILFLIHFTLFQNAFQIIYFLWIWYEFGLRSCFHENFNWLIVRVILGLLVQFLCSYITLPLYALVSQMGSNMKRSIFDEQTSKALKKWHQTSKKKQGKLGLLSSTNLTTTTPGSSNSAATGHLLPHTTGRVFRTGQAATTGHHLASASALFMSFPSRRRNQIDGDGGRVLAGLEEHSRSNHRPLHHHGRGREGEELNTLGEPKQPQPFDAMQDDEDNASTNQAKQSQPSDGTNDASLI